MANKQRVMILLVDESSKFRNDVRTQISSMGLVEQATSGFHALHLLEQKEEEGAPYDLIVVEHKMKEMKGQEVINLIRDRYRLTELSIVAYSEKVSEQDEQILLEAGASQVISKSNGFDKFILTVKNEIKSIDKRKQVK